MPAMTAITIKKYDNVTNIDYDILSKSAGDGTWAVWRQDTGNTAPYAARPTFSTRVTESQRGIRRVDVIFEYPYFYTDTTTSQVVVPGSKVTFKNGVLTVPQGIPVNVVQEAGTQFANLMGSSLMRSGFVTQTAFV